MKLIIPMGKTSTGKDTISRYINERYGIQTVISYTTRPIRENEVDGREHWFINESKMDEIVADEDNLLAYAKNPKTGHRYCATAHDLDPSRSYIYILNPTAYLDMIAKHPDLETVVIFMDLPERQIRQRAMIRGDRRKDINKRLDGERVEFESFKKNHFSDHESSDGVDLSGQKLYMISSLNTRDDIFSQVREILSANGF